MRETTAKAKHGDYERISMIEKEWTFYLNLRGCPLEPGVVRDQGGAMDKGHRRKHFASLSEDFVPLMGAIQREQKGADSPGCIF